MHRLVLEQSSAPTRSTEAQLHALPGKRAGGQTFAFDGLLLLLTFDCKAAEQMLCADCSKVPEAADIMPLPARIRQTAHKHTARLYYTAGVVVCLRASKHDGASTPVVSQRRQSLDKNTTVARSNLAELLSARVA
jgi:hypothetical protein